MNTIYLVMADIETVDRAFSTLEKARDYVRSWLKCNPYYIEHPELLEAALNTYINECKFD